MLTIWKYEVPIKSNFTLDMPESAEIKSLLVQNDIPSVYAVVNPKAKKTTRYFGVFDTGEQIESFDSSEFIGTFLIRNEYVGHLFERRK